jgi:hypothetical protein
VRRLPFQIRAWVIGIPALAVALAGMNAGAQSSIASKYASDQGIAADPAVIFAENFESPLSTILSRFKNWSQGAIVASTDRPAASGGAQSVQILPNGIGGTLYRNLGAEHDRLYLRYYIKYLSGNYHHTGAIMGGYFPRSDWALGDAGLKGVRDDGSKLFAVGMESMGTPNTRIDTYLNWVDMPGDPWNGLYYGRNFISDLNVPLKPGSWQCVEFMIKMNSAPTAHDGELAIWVDGVLKADFHAGSPLGYTDSAGNWHFDANGAPFGGFQWRDTLSYGINWFKIQNYDTDGAATNVLYDDLVLATQYIGPINSGAPVADMIPPAKPKSLRLF